MLPLLGILTAVFVGWLWKKEDMRAELTAEGGVDRKTYPIVRFLLRWVCPVLVSVVFVFGIIDFVKKQVTPEAVEEIEVVEEDKAPAAKKELSLRIKDFDIEGVSIDDPDFKPAKITPVPLKENNNNNNNNN